VAYGAAVQASILKGHGSEATKVGLTISRMPRLHGNIRMLLMLLLISPGLISVSVP